MDEDSEVSCPYCGQWVMCLETSAPAGVFPSYLCTRVKGHEGDHVACAEGDCYEGHEIARWENREVQDDSV